MKVYIRFSTSQHDANGLIEGVYLDQDVAERVPGYVETWTVDEKIEPDFYRVAILPDKVKVAKVVEPPSPEAMCPQYSGKTLGVTVAAYSKQRAKEIAVKVAAAYFGTDV